MKRMFLVSSFFGLTILAESSCGPVKKLDNGNLFTASALTPVHSFTAGAEGPAEIAPVFYTP
jgi:hypothetical protein